MDDDTLLLRAILREDWDTYNSMAKEFQDQGKGMPVATIRFAFYVGMVRYFAKRTEIEDEVIRFVARVRAAQADGRDIPALEAEALMYATLDVDLPGVAETIAGMDIAQVASIEGQLLYKLVRDESLTDDQIDELLAEAEDVGRWQADLQEEASPAEAES